MAFPLLSPVTWINTQFERISDYTKISKQANMVPIHTRTAINMQTHSAGYVPCSAYPSSLLRFPQSIGALVPKICELLAFVSARASFSEKWSGLGGNFLAESGCMHCIIQMYNRFGLITLSVDTRVTQFWTNPSAFACPESYNRCFCGANTKSVWTQRKQKKTLTMPAAERASKLDCLKIYISE